MYNYPREFKTWFKVVIILWAITIVLRGLVARSGPDRMVCL